MAGEQEPSKQAIQRTITESAIAGERAVSLARLLFCVVLGTRSAILWRGHFLGHEAERAWMTFPGLGFAMAFSVAVLLGLGRRRHTNLVLHLSVALDCVAATMALLPNALWPWPGYVGTTNMIDVSGLLIITVAAGLRLSTSAAILGGVLNSAAYAAIVVADLVVSGHHVVVNTTTYTMFGALLALAAGLAVIIAVRTRRLVARGAQAALHAAQAGDGLRSVLRDHHDLRTVLMSAQINADLVARQIGPGAVANLREDLGEIRLQIEGVKARALEELAGLDELRTVVVLATAEEVLAHLRGRFPAVDLAASADGAPAARVAGGLPALRRILSNLVVNACEGDGKRSAQRVEVRTRATGSSVRIEVLDDGPGLPAGVLIATPGDAASTKLAGAGLGIGMVDSLVRASGGAVTWANRESGGACVVIDLPAEA
jgi:signal transduction histidine kinase